VRSAAVPSDGDRDGTATVSTDGDAAVIIEPGGAGGGGRTVRDVLATLTRLRSFFTGSLFSQTDEEEEARQIGLTDLFRQLRGDHDLRAATTAAPTVTWETIWACDICMAQIKEGDVRWGCVNNDSLEDVDLCGKCHVMTLRSDSGSLLRLESEKQDELQRINPVAAASSRLAGPSRWVEQRSTVGKMRQRVQEAYAQGGIRGALEQACRREFAPHRALGMRMRDSAIDREVIFTWCTFEELWVRIASFAAALQHVFATVESKRALICGENSHEWLIADLGCAFAGVTSVCLHHGAMEYIPHVVAATGCEAAVISRSVVLGWSKEIPMLRQIVLFSLSGGTRQDELRLHQQPNICHFADFERAVSQAAPPATPRDERRVVTIMFTSGSTGVPKGIPFDETAWTTRVGPDASLERAAVWFSFQPLSHALDRVAVWSTLLKGGRIGFASPDKTDLMRELQAVAPTNIAATPRFWTSLHEEFKSELCRRVELLPASGGVSMQHDPREEARRELLPASGGVSMQHDPREEARRELLGETKKALGHRIKSLVFGGALTDERTRDFLWTCFGSMCGIHESYGATEMGAIASDGIVEDDVEIKLRDVVEMGYFESDGIGEVLVRRRQTLGDVDTFGGYVGGVVAEALDENGFYCTGDIARLSVLSHGRIKLTIVDRIKNIFKLAAGAARASSLVGVYRAVCCPAGRSRRCESNGARLFIHSNNDTVTPLVLPSFCQPTSGEFVAPARLEGIYESECASVQQCFITGSPQQQSVVAIVTLREGCAVDLSEVVEEMCRAGREHGLAPHELPAAVFIEPDAWSIANGGLTVSAKLARATLEKRFGVAVCRARL
jgi:long-subunit acyl-CoA synthetase (AMP-forming)